MGQFTQLDPIGMSGGLNLYGYANSDPVNFSDPSGLAACAEGQSAMECLAEGGMTIDDWNNGVDVCEPWPECRFQEIANYWARRSGAMGWIGLNLAAAGNAASEAFGTNDFFASAQAGDGWGTVLAAAGMLPVGRFGKLGKLNPNKLHHIFGKAGRALGPVVARFGSREQAFLAASHHLQALHDAGRLPVNSRGVFRDFTFTLDGFRLGGSGRIVNGVVRIGTFYPR